MTDERKTHAQFHLLPISLSRICLPLTTMAYLQLASNKRNSNFGFGFFKISNIIELFCVL